ncbi:cadherin-like domain-containing protein [Algimonas arctica]|uniref:cadherin-like domain-containing protein n=1 Tax=Algimonas arctica TaxID=1479486 RepID=UPI00402BA263
MDLSTLDGTNGFRIDGIDASDYSGQSVSSAGDVNGDGFDDFIIGAYRADPNGDSGAGESYVVFGGSEAVAGGALDLSTLDGTNGFRIDGIDANDISGYSVSSAGDVNGDGFDDLIIGAYQSDPNGNGGAGESYVVFGGVAAVAGGALDLSTLDGTNGFRLDGIDVGDQSGISVSSAGDVNGDGFDDLIIGARWADPNGDSGAGESYVVFGGSAAVAGGALDLSTLDGTNGFRIDGIDASDYSGRSVSSAGDVNGDGFDDLIIGAYRADPNGKYAAGESYVVFGGAAAVAGGALDLSTLDGTNGFRIDGIDAGDFSGRSVSSAGDVNGDGFDDLIIGAYRADPSGGSDAGESYVVFGGSAAVAGGALDLSTLDGTNGFRINGIDTFDFSGRFVSSAGDVNGDGFDDLIIGAPRADPNGDSYAGESYVVFGGAAAVAGGALDLSTLDGTNGFRIDGIDANDISGRSVSSAGDVNGDGFDDLIIGARVGDPNGDGGAGESYVIFGGATGTENTTIVTSAGTGAADNFTGNAGNDSFTGISTDDVVRGGAGDDSITVTSLDFADIRGGTGRDTIVLDGAGLSLDATTAGNAGLGSIEVIDITGSGDNTLTLDAQAVFDLTEERSGGMTTIDVRGNAGDSVDLSSGTFTAGTQIDDGNGFIYTAYTDGNAVVRVEQGVTVILDTGSVTAKTARQSVESDFGGTIKLSDDISFDPRENLMDGQRVLIDPAELHMIPVEGTGSANGTAPLGLMMDPFEALMAAGTARFIGTGEPETYSTIKLFDDVSSDPREGLIEGPRALTDPAAFDMIVDESTGSADGTGPLGLTTDQIDAWMTLGPASVFEPGTPDNDVTIALSDNVISETTTEVPFELATIRSNALIAPTPIPVKDGLERADLIFAIYPPNTPLFRDDLLAFRPVEDGPISFNEDRVLLLDRYEATATTDVPYEFTTIKSNVPVAPTPVPAEDGVLRADLVFAIEPPNNLLSWDDMLAFTTFEDQPIDADDDAVLFTSLSEPTVTTEVLFDELTTIKTDVPVDLTLEADVESTGGDTTDITPITELSLEADTLIDNLLIWDDAFSLTAFDDESINSREDAVGVTDLGEDTFQSLSVDSGDGIQNHLGVFQSLGVDDFGVVRPTEPPAPYEAMPPELLDFMDDLMLFADDGQIIDTGISYDA